MGTITARRRKDGTNGYTAQIRIMRNGERVYQESQTFDRKQAAQAWIKRRETELTVPGVLERAGRKGATVREMIERYLDEHEKTRPLGKTRRATLRAISETWLGETMDQDLTSRRLVEYAQWRMEPVGGGIKPQTAEQRPGPSWRGPLGGQAGLGL